QAAALCEGLVALENDPLNVQRIDLLMRAAHTIKGASRIVNLDAAVQVAHAIEEVLVAAQQGHLRLSPNEIDCLLRGVDLLSKIANSSEAEFAKWMPTTNSEVRTLIGQLTDLASEPESNRFGESPTSVLPGESAPPPMSPTGDGEQTLLALFREEVRSQTASLNEGLVALEAESLNTQLIEPLMRAAHSIKGAARIVDLIAAERVAHVLEDVLVAAQQHQITLTSNEIDLLLRGVDLLSTIGESSEADFAKWQPAKNRDVRQLLDQLTDVAQGKFAPIAAPPKAAATPAPKAMSPVSTQGKSGVYSRGEMTQPQTPVPVTIVSPASPESPIATPTPTMVLEADEMISHHAINPAPTAPVNERVVRVTAQNLSRLMSLAGESLVEARWLQPFAKSLQLLKRNQDRLAAVFDELHLTSETGAGRESRLLHEARQCIGECRSLLTDRIGLFEQHARQSDDLSSRLYFADGIQGFPRMVRDVARKLGKKIKFEILGHNTSVDRDILEKLEAPLNHILRNAIDHGLETPEQRTSHSKSEQGTLRLEARHRAGMLSITISDDGRGISLERLRRKVVEKGMSTPDLVASMNQQELLAFLFLPGFSTADRVTEVSGRGVGLDVVQSMVSSVGGSVRVTTRTGEGTTFFLQLPITLSVMRAVLVTIGGEPYAFPHNRIDRLLRLPRSEIRSLEGRQFFSVDGRNVGLVMAQQVFDLDRSDPAGDDLCVVLISDHQSEYGVIIDHFQGELDLVVRPLDARLGKIANVSAAALLEDGSPVLIVDVEDFLRSIQTLLQRGRLLRATTGGAAAPQAKKRILVVDDSITVREAERQLLTNRGYEVEVAVDGIDGWNTVRDADFDLVVSDIDMPRMNGLEFVKNIKQDARLKRTPVVIVSYKGREEDRLRGLEAGADYYLSKGSFHDDALIDVVVDLIGGPE
ncbi:MAG: chemotaxis protein histidine kinase-like protein, partial [Planctomycetota bacterium]